MNPQTYPIEAVALDRDGAPWYPFRPTPSSPVLFLQEPVLTIPGSTWEPTPPEFADRPHIPLDWPHLGELIFFACVPGDPYTPIDPDRIVADELFRLLAGVLTACRCNPETLDSWMVDEYAGGLSNSTYRDRLDHCRQAARRLCES